MVLSGVQPDPSLQTSPERKLVIVSDAHLPLDNRPGNRPRMARFLRLLKQHRNDTAVWILLGDTFDFWYDWRYVVPKHAFPLLHELRSLVEQGVEIHIFAGNHDFRLPGFLEQEIGLIVHLDEWSVQVDGRQVFFHHGDGMANYDLGYRRMKWVFRKPWMQWLFGTVIHPDLAMFIAQLASRAGLRKKARPLELKKQRLTEYENRARAILRNGYDLVIFGHTHNAMLKQFPEGWYHNTGSFDDEGAHSILQGDLPEGRKLT